MNVQLQLKWVRKSFSICNSSLFDDFFLAKERSLLFSTKLDGYKSCKQSSSKTFTRSKQPYFWWISFFKKK